MHGELIQFNSGDHVLGNKNVTEAVITDMQHSQELHMRRQSRKLIISATGSELRW